MLLALLLACRCTAPEGPQEATFPTPALREVGGRFRGEPDAPLDPKVAFTLQSRCPQIERARLRKANDAIAEVTVRGARLDAVTRIGAALPDGTLANVQFIREDGALVFPVACAACEVYLGVKADDRTVACIGPGYSLTVLNGRIVVE
jgi:hypothetical protein